MVGVSIVMCQGETMPGKVFLQIVVHAQIVPFAQIMPHGDRIQNSNAPCSISASLG